MSLQKRVVSVGLRFAASIFKALRAWLLLKALITLLMYVVIAVPAHALSDTCTAINMDWGASQTFAPPNGMRDTPYGVYSSFDVGETLSWTASAAGTAVANSTATVKLGFPNYANILEVGTDEDPNFSKSGTYTITSSAYPFDAFNVEVDVDNQLPGTSSAVTIQVICYDDSAPTITALSPQGGPVSGGTSVTVEGSAFVDVSEVTFGEVPASSYTVVSPTKIVAIAPANALGSAPVNVANGNGAASQNQSFIYAEPPVISPAAGALTAGIVGVNYNAATFSASDGVAPYSFAVADGDTLPAGLSLNATGEITGIPTTAEAIISRLS